MLSDMRENAVTAAEIARLKEIAQAATPGPWQALSSSDPDFPFPCLLASLGEAPRLAIMGRKSVDRRIHLHRREAEHRHMTRRHLGAARAIEFFLLLTASSGSFADPVCREGWTLVYMPPNVYENFDGPPTPLLETQGSPMCACDLEPPMEPQLTTTCHLPDGRTWSSDGPFCGQPPKGNP